MRAISLLLVIAFMAMVHVVASLSFTVPLKPLIQVERQGIVNIQSLLKRDSPLNAPLTDWLGGSDYQWYSTISVGTPPQNLTVIWKTGFNDLVIPRSNCTTCNASGTFDPIFSASFSQSQYGELYLSYMRGQNSTPLAEPELAHCNLVYDRVAIGNLAQENQAIILCDEYGPSLASMPIDGIIGLGPFDMASSDRPFFWNLWKTHQLNYPVFSLYLPAGKLHGAQITLGDVDETKYVGTIRTLGLDANHYGRWKTWVHHFNAIHVNGQLLPRSISGSIATKQDPFPGAAAFLDTGTAFIQVPDYDTARDLYGSLSSEIKLIDLLAADFVFTLSAGDEYMNVTLPQTAFNLGEYPGQPGICQAVFVHNTEPDSYNSYWVLGSPLLKAYYTVWDGLNLQVGWAELAEDRSANWFAP